MATIASSALDKLAKIPQPDAPATVNTQVNVGQLNVGPPGGDNALESLRRLAFALELTRRRLAISSRFGFMTLRRSIRCHPPE